MTEPVTRTRSRAADYFELTKPRIAAMALVTVAAGYLLGSTPEDLRFDRLLHTLVGAGLVAAGGSALNHWLERRADARMNRTANRPLPGGRVSPLEVFVFGVSLTILGVGYLAVLLPNPAAAIAAAFTAVLYVVVYTPLKRVTTWNTVVGAVPGALPPVIGWCAAQGTITPEGLSLFAILFVWQLPHFYSIAWLHRDDYARGGMRMLPVLDRVDGPLTGWTTALTCGVLVGVTAIPALFLPLGPALAYLLGALPLAGWFLARTLRFAYDRNDRTARSVLRGSLVYLVGVMVLLVATGLWPRYFAGS